MRAVAAIAIPDDATDVHSPASARLAPILGTPQGRPRPGYVSGT